MFYGWRIVGVSALGNAIAMGMGTLNFGLFITPMGNELGISRAEFGLAGSLRQYASAATSPAMGAALDRWGARWLLAGGMLVAGAALAALSLVQTGWQMIALFMLMGLVGVFGPGQLLTTVPVMKWFVIKRPRAVAMMSIGVPVGALVFMPLTQMLIDVGGWRLAWVVLGLTAIVVVVPASLIWMRRAPEDMGQRPDGVVLAVGEAEPPPSEHSWTRADAVRTLAFWQLVVVVSLIGMAISSIALHRIPEFVDRGIPAHMIALATAWDAVLAGLGTFAFGMWGHRASSRIFGGIGFALLSVGVVLMIYTHSTAMLFLAMSVWGFGIGGMMYMQSIIWAEFFGRDHVGAIRGFATPITLVVGGLGAPLAGLVHDLWGTYEPAWWAGAALLLMGAITIILAQPPRQMVAAP